MTTAVQFVSPLAIIIVTHFIWRFIDGGLNIGFGRTVVTQSMHTALALTVTVIGFAIVAPMPAEASGDLDGILTFIFGAIMCLAVVVGIFYLVAAITNLAVKGIDAIGNAFKKGKKPPKDTLNDFATVGFALVGVIVLSLEGISTKLTFPADGIGISRQLVKADIDSVWEAAATATSPDFPLPTLLYAIPQPVKILVDEGLDVGAKRVVLIAGREGSGELSMQIVKKTDNEATFKVLSDTSPVSMWVSAKNLKFTTELVEDGILLTVSSEFERRLSPAWFFQPLMTFAANQAVDTLARDIVQRAEAL